MDRGIDRGMDSGMSKRWVFFNGEFVPESEAKLSIYDSALMFGDMVFEMTRSFNKKQFKLREHIERLYASMKYLRLDLPDMPIEKLEKHALETIERNESSMLPDDEHRLMINVSRGLLGIYQDIAGAYKGPNLIIADFPLRWTVASMGKLLEKGVNGIIPSQRTIPAQLLEPKVKNRCRIHYLMANIEVSQMSGEGNWALLLDPDGFVAEGPGYNFFIVSKGEIITPEPRNVLRGISRQYIFDLARQMDLPCIEKNIEPYDVLTADEAFFTATPFCLMPMTRFNGLVIGKGTVGEMTQRLQNRWSENVGVDIVKQIQKWDSNRPASASSAPTPYSFKKAT